MPISPELPTAATNNANIRRTGLTPSLENGAQIIEASPDHAMILGAGSYVPPSSHSDPFSASARAADIGSQFGEATHNINPMQNRDTPNRGYDRGESSGGGSGLQAWHPGMDSPTQFTRRNYAAANMPVNQPAAPHQAPPSNYQEPSANYQEPSPNYWAPHNINLIPAGFVSSRENNDANWHPGLTNPIEFTGALPDASQDRGRENNHMLFGERLRQFQAGTSSTLTPENFAHLDDEQKTTVEGFSARLFGTAEYITPNTRNSVNQRMTNLLKLIATTKDEELRTKLIDIMYHALGHCGDRITAGLEEAEILCKIEAAKTSDRPRENLRELAKGLIKLDEVRKCAAQATLDRNMHREGLEVILAFQTELNEKLNLPTTNSQMMHGGLVRLSPREIEHARTQAESAVTPAAISAYLAAWEPWQKMERQEKADKCHYASLPYQRLSGMHEMTDTIMGTPFKDMENPVMIKGTKAIYELDDIKHAWLENGKNPVTNLPFELTDLRRLT
jgi:hypothetical protein